MSFLTKDFKDALSQDGADAKEDKDAEGGEVEQDDDGVYRLLCGSPSFIITHSGQESVDYRPISLRNQSKMGEGMGYTDPPPSRPYDPAQGAFFTSLVIKNENGDVDYRPVRLRGGADEDALPSHEVRDRDTAAPIPKFKLGDRVVWKRNLQDSKIQGTGTITKVHALATWIQLQTGARINHFSYEIDTAVLMIPGNGGYVNEDLIRSLKPPKRSWREYVESQGPPTKETPTPSEGAPSPAVEPRPRLKDPKSEETANQNTEKIYEKNS